ncbi:MAG: transcriptional regulator [Nitrososphaerales archaeon]
MEEVPDLSNTSQIFVELAGDLRRQMMIKLNQESLRLSELSKELNATMQEAHRNVNRLIEVGLVEKDPEGLLSLTTYGKVILKQIPTFAFLTEHKEYFEEHTVGDLPMKFIQRMGALYNGQLIKGVVRVLEVWKDIYYDANEYIYEIMAQVPLDLIEPLVAKIRRGVKFSYIFGQDVVVPKGRSELLQILGWRELMSKGLVERKMADKVQVMTVLNERQASVLFPNLKGEADLNNMFYSDDPLFHEWCLDYFRYKWYGSDIFDESKMKEV